jgi:succinate dehydrogenase / fumarate reductase flavoprotein subunit
MAARAEVEQDLHGDGTENPFRLHQELQTVMGNGAGIFRDEEGLTKAIAEVDEIARRAQALKAPLDRPQYNPGWQLCSELRNMITVAQCISRAALLRTESRGGHSRLDHTGYDDYWGEHNTLIHDDGGEMVLEQREVLRGEGLDALVEARKEAEKAS